MFNDTVNAQLKIHIVMCIVFHLISLFNLFEGIIKASLCTCTELTGCTHSERHYTGAAEMVMFNLFLIIEIREH